MPAPAHTHPRRPERQWSSQGADSCEPGADHRDESRLAGGGAHRSARPAAILEPERRRCRPKSPQCRSEPRPGHDFDLDAVRVIEEHGVIARRVGVLLRDALDPYTALTRPLGGAIDRSSRATVDRDVMNADRVAIMRLRVLRPPRAQANRAASVSTNEVVDGLTALALDLVNPSPAKRSEEFPIERHAPIERADDEIQVIDVSDPVVLPRGQIGAFHGSSLLVRARSEGLPPVAETAALDEDRARRPTPGRRSLALDQAVAPLARARRMSLVEAVA
jgi:hypothetical protein